MIYSYKLFGENNFEFSKKLLIYSKEFLIFIGRIMAKITELNDAQLIKQLEKYQAIVDEITRERNKRVKANNSWKGLMTAKEILEAKKKKAASSAPKPTPTPKPAPAPAPAAAQPSRPVSQEAADDKEQFQVSFDDEEIDAMNRVVEQEQAADEEEDEEVRVTQLLSLSKDQLAELQKNAQKINKKK